MGIYSKSESNGLYKVGNLIFPSKLVFSTIESIDRNLRILYSKAPPNSIWDRINYSAVRDDDEEFNAILDRVEERIVRFAGKVKLIETDDAAFNRKFLGIMDFLYEAHDFESNIEVKYIKQTPEYIKKRFIDLADRLGECGISPNEF